MAVNIWSDWPCLIQGKICKSEYRLTDSLSDLAPVSCEIANIARLAESQCGYEKAGPSSLLNLGVKIEGLTCFNWERE